jgi:hypothetical protein
VLGQARLFLSISMVCLAVTFFTFSLKGAGLFQFPSFGALASIFDMPAKTIVPLIACVASPIMGNQNAGAHDQGGGITEVQALTVLMLGCIFLLPVSVLRVHRPTTPPSLELGWAYRGWLSA